MTGTAVDLSIIIPCFNEAKNVTLVLEALKKHVGQSAHNLEIIVIDGGSTDNTPGELQTAFKDLPQDNFKLILNKERGGYGGDIMKALATARGDVLSWTHADLQTDPADVIKAYELYKELAGNGEAVFVKGARKNRRFMEALFTFGMQLIAWPALKTYISDINAQPKLFSRAFYNAHLKQDYPTDFSLDLFALYKAKTNGYTLKTIPVVFAKRLHGEAKGGGGGWKMRIKLIKRTFAYIFELRAQLIDKN